MGGIAFREHIPGFASPSAFVLDDPVVNIDHDYSPGSLNASKQPAKRGPSGLGAGALWTPDKHLLASVIQDPDGIRLLRHIQRLEEK